MHAGRRTPHFAIVVLFLMLALLGSITGPGATVFLLLGLFVVVNGALFVLQRRRAERLWRFEVPRIVPALGAAVCLLLIAVRVGTVARGRAPSVRAWYISSDGRRDQ